MASVMSREPAASAEGRMLAVQVLTRVPAARDVVMLALVAPGTRRAPAPYVPGQFITLAFTAAHRTYYRSYSLCGDGRIESPWEITIKRHDAGLISRHLFDRIQPGMLLRASPPQGSFTLPAPPRPGVPIVFVAGGSGIAPIYGMLRALARLTPEQRPRVWLHYAYHSPASAIYSRELAALDPQRQWLTQWHYVASNGYHLRPEHVLAPLGAGARSAHWYVCGPESLKRTMQASALRQGVPAEHFHSEVFASPVPRDATAAASGMPALVRLADTGTVLTSPPGATLLETLERAGFHPDFSCRAGACGTCRLRLVAGRVSGGDGGDGGGLTAAERASGYVLSCVARPLGEVTLASAGVPLAPDGARRRPGQRALRLGLTAAAAAVFLTAWGFTNHSPVTAAATSTSGANDSTSSNSSGFPSLQGGDDNNGGSSGQNPFGSGSFSNQPSTIAPNSSSGVS